MEIWQSSEDEQDRGDHKPQQVGPDHGADQEAREGQRVRDLLANTLRCLRARADSQEIGAKQEGKAFRLSPRRKGEETVPHDLVTEGDEARNARRQERRAETDSGGGGKCAAARLCGSVHHRGTGQLDRLGRRLRHPSAFKREVPNQHSCAHGCVQARCQGYGLRFAEPAHQE